MWTERTTINYYRNEVGAALIQDVRYEVNRRPGLFNLLADAFLQFLKVEVRILGNHFTFIIDVDVEDSWLTNRTRIRECNRSLQPAIRVQGCFSLDEIVLGVADFPEQFVLRYDGIIFLQH